MSGMQPFAQLIGPADVYVAVYGTAIPNIDATPGVAWAKLGPTSGDQTIRLLRETSYWQDNDGLGDVTARNINAGAEAEFTLVGLTYENLGRILHNIANVSTATSGAVSVKELPFSVDYVPTEYAILVRGVTDSPYGVYPAQNYIPRGIFADTTEMTKGRSTRAEVPCLFHGLRDDAQNIELRKFGWSQAQIS